MRFSHRETADIINETKKQGGRVICVGTTSCRTIESAADESGHLEACSGDTSIFIYPGYKFKCIDNLITNIDITDINDYNSIKSELLETYPDAKIYCVDSLISTLGQGLLAIEASKMRDAGSSIEEVVAWLEEHRLEMNQIATVSSLEYLKRAGRIKTSKAFFGNLFNVKPLIISDVIGQNYAFKKIKGRQSSLEALVSYTKENIVDSENQIIGIAHADCLEEALYVKEQLLKEIKCQDIIIDYIGPIVGSSVGPGTIGIYFMGNKVSIQGE